MEATAYNLCSVITDWTAKKVLNDEVLSTWSSLIGKNKIIFLHCPDLGHEKPTRIVQIKEDMAIEVCL